MNKYEQLIEYIINEEEGKARELFHEIVVERSRDIYEGLMDEEDMNEVVQQGNEVESLSDEVSDDEVGMHEDEDEFEVELDGGEGDLDPEMDMDSDMDMDGGEEGEFGAEEASDEDRIVDLEDAIDELRAEFDRLMSAEEEEGHDFGDMDDEGSEDEFGDEDDMDMDVDAEEEPKIESASVYGEGRRQSAGETMREYVEKVSNVERAEGGAVGSGGTKNTANTKSIVAGKNDMGGTSANIAKGGSESAPDGTSATKKPSNQYTKGQGNLKGAGSFENVPGAKTKGYTNKKPTVSKEEAGVEKKSLNLGRTK